MVRGTRAAAGLWLGLLFASIAACTDPRPLDARTTTDQPAATSPADPRDFTLPAPSGTTTFLPAGDHEVPAVLTLPQGASAASPVPGVVLLHGTGGNKAEVGDAFMQLAEDLADAGIASIRFDFLGSGESTGDAAAFDFSSAREDALVAAAHLQSATGVDPERVGILGYSQGGVHALLLAAGDDRFSAVVTWAAPAEGMSALASDSHRSVAAEQGYFEFVIDEETSVRIGQQWIDDADDADVPEAITQIAAPILAINGADDVVVQPENAQRIADLSPNPESSALVVASVGHTFGLEAAEVDPFFEVSSATVDWFVAGLADASG